MVSLGGGVRSENELQSIKKGPAGWYLALIDAADESKVMTDNKLTVDFQLIAGTNPTGVGCVHQERFDVGSEFGQKNVTKLALSIGLLTANQLGQDQDVPFDPHAIGRCCLIQIVDHEYPKKVVDEETGVPTTKLVQTTQIKAFEMHAVNSKEAARFPFVAQAIAARQVGGATQQQQAMPGQAAAQVWPGAQQQGPVQPNDWASVAADF